MQKAAAMEARAKGRVTPLSSMFPAEEALKASQRVHETIIEKRKELDTLHHFVSDNTNLINLVKRLPDELHHQIMVPFGKAAFFPGRLVHTNELTVFLGENYYAERTAKQTIDILTRRGKTLESHVDSLKAVIKDLKTEASFFDRTAGEAEEGLVEIREEYTDEDSEEAVSISGRSDAPRPSEEGNGGGAVDDEEYTRIMSRFDELEREELEAGDNSEDDEHGDTEEPEDDEHEDFEELEDDEDGDSEEEDGDDHEDTEESHDDEHDESSDNLELGKVQPHVEELSDISHRTDADKLNLGNLIMRSRDRDESSHGKALMHTEASKRHEKDYVPSSILKTRSQSSSISKQVSFQIPEPDGGSRIVGPVTKSLKAPVQMPKSDAGSQPSRRIPNTDSLKAFSGTIVERTDNLPMNPEQQTTSQPSNSQSSRPVSRFKMQRMAQGLN